MMQLILLGLTFAGAACGADVRYKSESSPAMLLDDFLGSLIDDLKAELVIAREGPREISVPEFQLTPWGPAPGAPALNESFDSNPNLIAAKRLVERQATTVEALKENATAAVAALTAKLHEVKSMENELARVTAEIKAAEAREVEVQQSTVRSIRSAEIEGRQSQKEAESKEEKRMMKLEARAKREVSVETKKYNSALHHVLANAGAVLHQQEGILHEKKTLLQEAADRAELPELVDYIGGKVGSLTSEAKNISASRKAIRHRMSSLNEDIKETMALIANLEGGNGSSSNRTDETGHTKVEN